MHIACRYIEITSIKQIMHEQELQGPQSLNFCVLIVNDKHTRQT